jgi:hypothetical protein
MEARAMICGDSRLVRLRSHPQKSGITAEAHPALWCGLDAGVRLRAHPHQRARAA